MEKFLNLKEKGNKHFSSSDYDEALACYTEAITLQPQSHVIFSNRSATFIKLKKYQEALADADQCIILEPKFARGHLRRAVALNGLQRHSEAMPSAEEGCKLRASDRICKDCITEWLVASTAVLKPDVDKMDDIPPGTSPITKKFMELLYMLQQNSSSSGVTLEFLQTYLSNIIEELERLLERFGHALSSYMSEWVAALLGSLKVDPRTHAAPKVITEVRESKLKELVNWLDTEVDHILYPVLRPVFALLSVTMLTCASNLGHVLSFRSHIQILTRACLVFHTESLLCTEEYAKIHIHAMQLLLNSYCMESGHAGGRKKDEATKIKSISQKLQALLSRYNPSSADYAEVKRSTQEVISNASILLSSDGTPVESKRLTKEDSNMLKGEVTKELEALKMKLKESGSLHIRDMDSLVLATGGLVHVGEAESAKMALNESGLLYQMAITHLLDNKLLPIDDAAECFFHPQTMMICNTLFLAGIDDCLLADVVIQWKCLATELYALLASLGLGKSLMNTFNKIEAFKITGKGECEKTLLKIQDEHQKECMNITKEWGGKVISTLLQQSWTNVQKSLAPDQILLQYCMSPLYDTSYFPVPIPPKVLSLKGIVLGIRSEGIPIVKIVDFGRIQDMAVECHNLLMKVVSAKGSGKPWENLQQTADKKANDLLQHMLPGDLQMLVNDATIQRVYFCPDQVLSKFPIEILPLKNGQLLGEKVAVTYLSSAREILRASTVTSLSLSASGQNITEPAECAIFANPNFDLESLVSQSESHWGLLSSFMSSLFSETKATNIAVSLPNSEIEAQEIEQLLTSTQAGGKSLNINVSIGNDATLCKVLHVQSPLLLHFATHGFSSPDFHYQYHNFWSDTKSGLLLAGANTYHQHKHTMITDEAGTGELTALAACGMKLTGTRLVYLSCCRSSYGFIGRGEALSSLAQGFRIAGSSTVVATLWPVSDEVGHKMALHFYHYVLKCGMHVSLALQAAKRKLQAEKYHWYDWAGFLCIGIDTQI